MKKNILYYLKNSFKTEKDKRLSFFMILWLLFIYKKQKVK